MDDRERREAVERFRREVWELLDSAVGPLVRWLCGPAWRRWVFMVAAVGLVWGILLADWWWS